MTKPRIVIVGAGPAGLTAYQALKKRDNFHVDLFESGPDLDERLKTGLPINGKGGAGLWSDRKLSGGCAGSGLLKTSPYILRDAYRDVLMQMADALPHLSNQFQDLLTEIDDFLGDQTVSSEELDRRVSDFTTVTNQKLAKLYPSLVLPDFKFATDLIRMYDTAGAQFNTKVTDIVPLENGYSVLTKSYSDYDFVILAMGRFGPCIMSEFKLFEQHLCNSAMRLEIGVRVNVGMYPLLKQGLMKIQSESKMIADPKFKLTQNFMIGGHCVPIEFRSFCVCLPTDGRSNGYAVWTRDRNTGFQTWSGSSSGQELIRRQDCPSVKPGSNLGIMMRICDPLLIRRFAKEIGYLRFGTHMPQTRSVGTMEDTINLFQMYYPADLCYPLYHGMMEMLYNICGQAVEEPLTLHVPCIEGVGLYPNVDPSTYQLEGHPKVLIAGDNVGHTRGLLQACVMGKVVTHSVITQHVENTLRKYGMLQDYQSILLPTFSYNKTLPNLQPDTKRWKALFRSLDTILVDSLQKLDHDRFNEIYNDIHRVRFTATGTGNMDVIYELHHFFLDKNVYGNEKQLHYISQKAMLEYILMCNVIDQRRDLLQEAIHRHTDKVVDLSGHQFKSCILALRTRSSLELRDLFHDIPVMQSAFKLMSPGLDTEDQVKVVATVCTLLDSFFKTAIEEANLDLAMVRSKIECQEPGVESIEAEPLYFECHVKVNIKQADGGSVEYNTKKQCIQELSNLFEGRAALVQEVFNVMAVSINLLKHPEHGQQFFLTYRTDTKEQMKFIRQNWKQIMDFSLQLLPQSSILRNYKFSFYTDAEFVLYDDMRSLDLPWFPIIENFLHPNYQQAVFNLCSPKKCIVVSTNPEKVKEISSFLQLPCVRVPVPPLQHEEQSLRESAIQKVTEGYKLYRRPVIAESTGLYIDGMNQYPGSHTKHVINSIGERGLIRLADDAPVKAVTVVAYHDGQQVHVIEGYLDGNVKETDTDHHGGFGWDNIFYPTGSLLPLSSLPTDTKHMRRDALVQLSTLFH